MRKMLKLLLKKKEARFKKSTLKVILLFVKIVSPRIQVISQHCFHVCIGIKNSKELMDTNVGPVMMNLLRKAQLSERTDNVCPQWVRIYPIS